MAEEGDDEAAPAALPPFPRITRAATEALRYRAEDIARSLTKAVIKEVSHRAIRVPLYAIPRTLGTQEVGC